MCSLTFFTIQLIITFLFLITYTVIRLVESNRMLKVTIFEMAQELARRKIADRELEINSEAENNNEKRI